MLEKSVTGPKPAPVAAPALQNTDAERLRVLEEKEEQRKQEAISNAKKSAIETGFSTGNKDTDGKTIYNAAQLRALRATFNEEHGNNVIVEDGKAFYNSPETGKIPVDQFITTNFLKSEVAAALKPAAPLPSGDALSNNGRAGKPAAAGHEWSGKTATELQALARQDPAKFRDFSINHTAAFNAAMKRR